jgi:hypothetical protein
MTFAVLLPLLIRYAPDAIGLIGHVVQNIAAGRSQATVTDSDWAELDRLAALTGEAIYARLGIQPPPPKPTA